MSEPTGEESGEPADGRAPDIDAEGVRQYLQWGALVGFALLAAVAAVGLYTSLSSIIDVWVGDRFQPVARAVFNFAVLCVAGVGTGLVLRRR